MEEPDAEVGAAVMKAVFTMVEMTPFEFEVIVVKVEVAFRQIWCQQLIKSTMSTEQDGRNGAENILPLLVGMDVVLAELFKKLSHADGVSPSDVTTCPEANANADAVALSQQLPVPPTSPLQQPKT